MALPDSADQPRSSPWRDRWPGIVSALLLTLAFPPFNLRPLVFLAFVPWLIALRGQTARGAVRSGYTFGLVFMLAQLQWLQVLTHRWTHSLALSLIPWLGAALVTALFFALAGCLMRLCWVAGRPWLIPLVWAGVEVLRSYAPGIGFPWGLTALPLTPYPAIIQPAALGTVFLISAWVLLVNVIAARLVARESVARLWPAALIAVAMPLLSALWYARPIEGLPVLVAVGQPGLDLAFGEPVMTAVQAQASVLALSDEARQSGAAFLLLPEGMAASSDGEPPVGVPIGRVPVVFGARRGSRPAHQSVFAYDGHWSYADKTRLVIFGEYVPGRGVLPLLDSFNLPNDDLIPGSEIRTLDVAGIRLGPMICFEALFPDIAYRQARNDGRGRLLAQAPLRARSCLAVEAVLPSGPQTFPFLPAFPWIAVASCLVVPVFARRRPGATQA
ncbi:MAG: hypothetical protein HY248_04820 [Fimbriimonas ginsengisoli]|nr:hypothetical protein [Fimbriimonas ginsengisoli]